MKFTRVPRRTSRTRRGAEGEGWFVKETALRQRFFSSAMPASVILVWTRLSDCSLVSPLRCTSPALDEFAPAQKVALKWPNDVLVNQRKICGVLAEVGGRRRSRIFGIGINANNSFDAAPVALRAIATSLIDLPGTGFDVNEILIGVLRQMERQLKRLSDG